MEYLEYYVSEEGIVLLQDWTYTPAEVCRESKDTLMQFQHLIYDKDGPSQYHPNRGLFIKILESTAIAIIKFLKTKHLDHYLTSSIKSLADEFCNLLLN